MGRISGITKKSGFLILFLLCAGQLFAQWPRFLWEQLESDITNFYIGATVESAVVSVESDGATVDLIVTASDAGSILDLALDGGFVYSHSVPDTIALTAGSDASPTLNYVYIDHADSTLKTSTSDWPNNFYTPIATVLLQTASATQDEGALKVHAWTDHLKSSTQGHLGDVNFWIRQQPASYVSGVDYTVTLNTTPTPDDLYITTTSGVIMQLHDHAYPAFSDTTAFDYIVPNHPDASYTRVNSLADLDEDATGTSLNNKYYALVVWGVVSEDTEDSHLMVNLPTGSYTSESDLTGDVSSYAVYDIPGNFTGTGFLIAKLNLQSSGGGNVLDTISFVDLRGLKPSVSPAAGGGTGSATTTFADNQFAVYNVSDNTKILNFDVSGVTTSTTRTLTVPDNDGTIALTSDITNGIFDATNDGGTVPTGMNAILTDSFQIDYGGNVFSLTNDLFYVTDGGGAGFIEFDLTGDASNSLDIALPSGERFIMDPDNLYWESRYGNKLELHTSSIDQNFQLTINPDNGTGDAVIIDSRVTATGLEYNADYSAGFTARSLVDKAYVDANSGHWTLVGSDIYYDAGQVAVGTSTFLGALNVVGNVGSDNGTGVFMVGTNNIDSIGASSNGITVTGTGNGTSFPANTNVYGVTLMGADNFAPLWTGGTANDNTGFGRENFEAHTFGSGNFASGLRNFESVVSGEGNFASGQNNAQNITTDSDYNFLYGEANAKNANYLRESFIGGNGNVGTSTGYVTRSLIAGFSNLTASGNIISSLVVGDNNFDKMTAAVNRGVAIGTSNWNDITSGGIANIGMPFQVADGATDVNVSYATGIGYEAFELATGELDYGIAIGYRAGRTTAANNSVHIGKNANATRNKSIYIGSATDADYDYIDFAADQVNLPSNTSAGVATPAAGDLYYDTDNAEPTYYNGSAWVGVTSGGGIYGGSGTLSGNTTVTMGSDDLYFEGDKLYFSYEHLSGLGSALWQTPPAATHDAQWGAAFETEGSTAYFDINNAVIQATMQATWDEVLFETDTARILIDTLFVITDKRTNFMGVEYAADYSSGYTSRSLVDKAYVDDNTFSGTVGDDEIAYGSSGALTSADRFTVNNSGVFRGIDINDNNKLGSRLRMFSNNASAANAWDAVRYKDDDDDNADFYGDQLADGDAIQSMWATVAIKDSANMKGGASDIEVIKHLIITADETHTASTIGTAVSMYVREKSNMSTDTKVFEADSDGDVTFPSNDVYVSAGQFVPFNVAGASLPTGITGGNVFNTTANKPTWYDGTDWQQPDWVADRDYGVTTGSTDGSGDLTVNHDLNTATIFCTALPVGTTFYNLSVHTKTSTTFKIRFFDAAGSAVTSTSVTVDWIARK